MSDTPEERGIKRYTPEMDGPRDFMHIEPYADDDGDWVKYEDHLTEIHAAEEAALSAADDKGRRAISVLENLDGREVMRSLSEMVQLHGSASDAIDKLVRLARTFPQATEAARAERQTAEAAATKKERERCEGIIIADAEEAPCDCIALDYSGYWKQS